MRQNPNSFPVQANPSCGWPLIRPHLHRFARITTQYAHRYSIRDTQTTIRSPQLITVSTSGSSPNRTRVGTGADGVDQGGCPSLCELEIGCTSLVRVPSALPRRAAAGDAFANKVVRHTSGVPVRGRMLSRRCG